MSRQTRTFIDFACYHIIVRGNRRQKIYRTEQDIERYLRIIKKAKKKHKIRLYAYCIMSNHVHILVEAEISANISKFMHWVNRGYTAYYNARYNKVGHLWQGIFLSKPILKGQYLIHCANYIEANPVRAGIVDDIAEYSWSSYRERCLLSEKHMLDEIKIGCENNDGGTPLILEKGTT